MNYLNFTTTKFSFSILLLMMYIQINLKLLYITNGFKINDNNY